MLELLKRSLHDFKTSYKKYLSFELIYMLLTSFIFVPLISFIFNRMLKIMGTGSLLNAEVYKIGSSYTGLSGMLFISLLTIVILFVEFGVIIIISQQRYFHRSILISEALITTSKKLPTLLGLGFFQLVPILWVIFPFIDSSTLPVLLDFNISIFLTSQLAESYFSMFIYAFVFLLIVYLFIRLIFTLHFVFVEDRSILKAMKHSLKATKHNNLKILLTLCLLNVLIYTIGFLFMTFSSYLITVIETKIIGDVVENYFITFASYLTIIASLLLIPINIIIITRLFYQFKIDQGDIVKDQLTVSGNGKLTVFENIIARFSNKRKYLLLSVTMVYITGVFLINYTVNDSIVYLKWDVEVASHRGDLKNAPENSLSSIRSAIDKGVDAIEIDVMMTKDGVVVLSHDSDLQRTAGISSEIKDMTYEELAQIDIGKLYSDEFIGETIPTLDMVSEEVKKEDVKLIIDIKPTEFGSELAGKVVDIIEKHEMEDVSYVQSFDYNLLQEIHNKNSDIIIGQILFLAVGNLAGLNVDFYTIRQSMLTQRFIENARKQNREVWVWTVNIERNMKEVLKYDIDGIITDNPEKVQNVLELDFSQEN